MKANEEKSYLKQVICLAALEIAITIGWIAYEKYQPQLLRKFDFVQFASVLLIAQGVLGAIFHPVSGYLSDKMHEKNGTKFPLIISGAAFAAVIFIAVSLAVQTAPSSNLKWILPILIILWLAAMATFHSPSISLVENFAPVHKIPNVAAILTIVFGLTFTIEPFILQILDRIGIPLTFVLGGILVMLTAYAIKYINQTGFAVVNDVAPVPEKQTNLFILFGMGFLIGFFKSIILFGIPSIWLSQDFLDKSSVLFSDADYLESAILFFSAISAIFVSKLVEKWTPLTSLLIGCVVAFLLCVVSYLVKHQNVVLLMLIAIGATYALLAVASLPYILSKTRRGNSGYSVGLYYGGVSASTALVLLLLYSVGIDAN
ncbi:MAG: MFS transporter [Cytophagales bacterium]|nr:MFS transporter [Cytophagales bacterium]MDW8384119.1 MFS transporter [Flammeovirgaceae bacterium]